MLLGMPQARPSVLVAYTWGPAAVIVQDGAQTLTVCLSRVTFCCTVMDHALIVVHDAMRLNYDCIHAVITTVRSNKGETLASAP